MSSNVQVGVDLTEGSISRNLIKLIMPMLIGNFLNITYNIVDSIWIGQIEGPVGLAANAVSTPMALVLLGVGQGLTIATSVLAAQYFGAKNVNALKHVGQVSSTIIIMLSALLLIIAFTIAPYILRITNTPENVFTPALEFFRINIFRYPLLFYYFLISALLRSMGDTVTPLIFLAVSSILNMILDPILMLGIGPFPRLGLNGAAIATVFSQFISVLLNIIYVRIKKSPATVNPFKFVLDKRVARIIFKIGIPLTVGQLSGSLSWVILTGLVNTFGQNASAALGAASKLEAIPYIILVSISSGIATMVSQSIGADKTYRIKQVFIEGLKLSIGMSFIIALFAVVFSKPILSIFTTDTEVIPIATSFLYIVMPSLCILSISYASNGVINGAGKSLTLMLFSFLSLFILRIPVAYFLSKYIGINGIWFSMSFACILNSALSLYYYLSKKWIKGSKVIS